MLEEELKFLRDVGCGYLPHSGRTLYDHLLGTANILLEYERPDAEVKAGLFHSIYGTEFQMYKIHISRQEVQDVIGENSEHIVNLFCTLNDRVNTILYGKGLSEPDKTNLRWLEYCNIKDQDPEAQILKEFEMLLTVNQN